MKLSSALLAIALVSSAVLAPAALFGPVMGEIALTPAPLLVHSTDSITETLCMAASDSGRIYAVWSERVGESTDIFMSFSSNNGTTFSPPVRVNGAEAGLQKACQVATADDSLYVVWEDSSSDGGDIILGRSLDGGITFQELRVNLLAAGTQSNPTIAAAGSHVAVAWEEYRSDNLIRIWNGVNGAKIRELAGHTAAVRGVEFSPNGTYLASCSEDATVKIWGASSGSMLRNITGHSAEVMALNWSADGSMLATGAFDHNVTLYNTSDFSVITRLDSAGGIPTLNNVNSVCFSPDSSLLAAGYHGQYGTSSQPTGYPNRNFNITVWNLTDLSSWTRNEDSALGPNRSHTDSVLDVAFSHGGAYLASGGKGDTNGNTLKVWHSGNGTLFRNFALSWPVHSVSWSADDSHIAAGLGNGTVAIVNVSNVSDIVWAPDVHTGRVNSLDWSLTRDEIVSGASDPVVMVRDHISNAQREGLEGHMNSVYSVDWSSGDLIATAGGNSHFYSMGENQIFCAVSDDSGASFGYQVMVSDSCASSRLRPRAAMGEDGNFSIAWYDARKGGTNIYYTNTSDRGATFEPNLGVSTDSNENTIPALFADSAGTAHVVWQFGNGAGIKYANSKDGFAGARVMATTAQMPKVTGSPDGSSVIVSWRHRNVTEMKNYLYMSASYDGGAGFEGATVLNSTANFIGEQAVFVDAYNQTFASWEMKAASSEQIYFRTTVLGDAWGPEVASTSPTDGQTGVSIFSSFTITFSEPMDRVSVESAFSWTDGTRTWRVGNCTDNSGYWYDDAGGYGDKVTFTPKKDDRMRYLRTSYSFSIGPSATDLAGNTLGSTLVVHFTTSADTDPPVIEHYPSMANISYNLAYGVMAVIEDQWGNVSSAMLHYQGVGDSTVSRSVTMGQIAQGMYMADIPPQLALGRVHYYISAEDDFGNQARSPADPTNHSALHAFDVVDGVKPLILHDPVVYEDVYRDIEIWAVVSDAILLQEVQLNYRGVGAAGFTSVSLQPDPNGTADTYSHTIPAQQSIGQVQYNITALDRSGNRNSTASIAIQIVDRTPPMINRVTPVHLENETMVRVTANVTDDVEVDTVTLYFKSVGGDLWVSREMERLSGDEFSYTIPAQRRSGTIYYYVNATDTSGNVASTLTEDDQFQIEVVGVSGDNTLYYFLGIVLALLIVILLDRAYRRYASGKAAKARKRAGGAAEQEARDDAEAAPPKDAAAPDKGDDGR